jgi:hypothetical protein
MSLVNGAPSVRIWRVGTNRILGVSQGQDDEYFDPDYCDLPPDILAKLSWDTDLFGDFVLCPFERSQPEVMQRVCVDGGKNLLVRPRSSARW